MSFEWKKPPTYDKLGKTQADFFKKKFQKDVALKLLSSADGGNVKFESEIKAAKGGLAGNFKVVNTLDLPGSAEVELNTDGKFTGTFKHDKVATGAKLKLVATDKQNLETTVDYAKDSFNTTITVDASKTASTANVAAVVGYDGLSVGVNAVYDFKNVTDYNAATEYTGKDFVASVKTESKADKIVASYLHSMNRDIQLATRFTYQIGVPTSRSLEVGAHFDIDSDSYARVKGDSNGNIETVFSQRFSNPALSYSLGFQFDANAKTTSPKAWGFGVDFGNN